MRRLAFVLAVAIPLTFALPATVVPAAAQEQAKDEATPPPKGKIVKKEVCRTMTYTGTHTRKRVCQTVEQWVDETARANGEQAVMLARGSFLQNQDSAAAFGSAGPR